MIREDSRVIMHVTVRVQGELIHTTTDASPLDVALGTGGLASGLEAAVIGLEIGDKKTATVPPEDAFGPHDPAATQVVPKDAFSDLEQLSVGDAVRGDHQGRPFTAFIQEIGDDAVTLDFNHPLAGKTVDFEIEILDVPPTT